MTILICVGSSCHLKGSEEIVNLLQNAIAEHHLENQINLAGSFCFGMCNRTGVTIQVDDDTYPGITVDSFPEFFHNHVLSKLGQA